MKKRGKFDYLHTTPHNETPKTPHSAKQVVFWLMLLFFLLYLKYKPYTSGRHIIHGTVEYLFYLYHFVINQTVGIVHEAGHGICYLLPCPRFIMVANGTLFQWLFPFGVGYYYKKRGQMVGYFLGLFVLGVSMDYTAWYMSTAPEGAFVPASKSFLGIDGYHDFNYIFDTFGVLAYSGLISGIVKAASFVVMVRAVIGLFFEAYPKEG